MQYSIPRLKILGAALLISIMSTGAAHANLITLNYNFTASGFLPPGAPPSAAPFDPVTGSFSLTFDNSADITNSSAIIANISMPVTGGIVFSYVQSSDLLILGGSLSGANSYTDGTNDFVWGIDGASTILSPRKFSYTTSNFGFWDSTNIVLTPAGAAVPETGSSVMLLGLALAGMAAARRARFA